MNNLLIFFAFPVATIIFAIALQKILKAPLLVSALVFAVFLIVTFTAFTETFLVFAILYSLIALVTALITRFIHCMIKNSNNSCIHTCICSMNEDLNDENENGVNENNSNCCNYNNRSSYNNQFLMRRNIFRR